MKQNVTQFREGFVTGIFPLITDKRWFSLFRNKYPPKIRSDLKEEDAVWVNRHKRKVANRIKEGILYAVACMYDCSEEAIELLRKREIPLSLPFFYQQRELYFRRIAHKSRHPLVVLEVGLDSPRIKNHSIGSKKYCGGDGTDALFQIIQREYEDAPQNLEESRTE